MVVQILTYEHANDLLYNPDFPKEMRTALHITATSSLKRGIMSSVSGGNRWIEAPVLSFGQLVPHIGNGWFSSKSELLQYTTLSKAMRKFVDQPTQPYNERIFQAIDKNQKAVLRTIRSFIDAGITLKDAKAKLKNPSDEEKLAFELWGDLEKIPSFERYEKWFKAYDKDPLANFRKVVEAALEPALKDAEVRARANILPGDNLQQTIQQTLDRAFDKKQGLIVFHGFYFITPVQKRILDRLAEQENFRVVYLIQYNERYKETFKTVETFLDFDAPNTTVQKITKRAFPVNHIAKKFIHMIEGDVEDAEQQNVSLEKGSLLEFNHMYQFKNHLQHFPDEIIISPRASTVRKYTEDLLSATDAELKDYPIGQFLIDIHRLNKRTYKPDETKYDETEKLDYQLLLKIFNSDYLMIGEQSAKRYMPALQKIAPIMQECETLEDWLRELDRLKEQKVLLERAFEVPDRKTGLEHDLYTYPTRFLSYLNVPLEELDKIKEGVIQLKELYEKLYVGSHTSIGHYIEELQEYMDNNIHANKTGEEQRIVKQVIEKLDNLKDEDFNGIERTDLILGLQYFLATSADQESDLGEPIDTGKSNSSDAVLGLQDADKLPFMQNRFVHLAFMDNKALPMGQKLSLWPFQRQSIELIENTPEGIYLSQIRLRKEMSASITAYLIYVVLQRATKAKFSIVKNFEDEHNLTTSFYIELLNLPKGCTEIEVMEEEFESQYDGEDTLKTLTFHPRADTNLIRQTKNYCQKRFVMSYLLQDRVDYVSDFHHSFMYRNYLQIYYSLQKQKKVQATENEINQYIDSWFPQWSPLKKEMLRQNAKNYFDNNDTRLWPVTYDGVTYADSYKRIALFGKGSTPLEKYANSGEHCMYCPFQLFCKESEIDAR